MNKRNLFSLKNFLLLFLLATLLSTSIQEDTCPTGMRKMYLDETTAFAAGSARNFIPALNFYEGNGALWYNRKILIEPRFEVHLKANIEPTDIVESSVEQVLEGFTIVISNAKNTVGHGSGDTIGYFGFTKSYVMEFDFNKNANDIDSCSYSLRYCDTECSSDDTYALMKGKLSNQRFDPNKIMNWDFRLVYIDHVLTVYSGPNEVLLTYEVDLQEKFGSYIANIGFTGYMKGNRRELSLSGTFVCEDNYDMSKIDGKFYVKENAVETADYRAGQKVIYMFQFKNNKGQVIPHCYKNYIWNYDFSLVVDCSASNYQISVKDDYSLFLSMNACSEIGKHEIRITEKTHGDGLIVRSYNILSGDVSKISLIGHDGQNVEIPKTLDAARNAQVLKYGPLNGDFSLTSSLTVTLDFSVTDEYGNTVNLGETSSEMLDVSQMALVNNNGAKVSMSKKDTHYQLIIQVVNTGTYQIVKNQYMTESYVFVVRAGGIDATNSYCTIEGVMEPPTKQSGDHVFYTCYFKDSSGNTITASDFTSMSEYEFQCGISKKSSTESLSVTISTQNSVFQCEHVVGGMGEYSFAGYLVKKGSSTKTELPAKINNFSVSPSFNLVSLLGAKILNPNSRLWYPIENFSFNYKADSNGFITAIDLTDSDHTTLISSFGKYPSDFAFSNFKALLLSQHDQYYSKDLAIKRVDLYGKEYIGIYTSDGASTDNVIKKSSFDYQLRFVWSSIDKTVTMKYKFSQPVTLGTYTTCFHDLNPKYTSINFDTISLTNNGVEQFLGTMELRTNDKNLYNYDVGISNIQLKLDPSNSNVNFRVEANVVLGTYNLYGSSTTQFEGTLYFFVNKGQADKSVKAKSGKGKTCHLKFVNPEFFTWTRLQGNKDNYYSPTAGAYVNGFLDFYFRLYDCEWFQLKHPDLYDGYYNKEIYGTWGQDMNKYKCTWDYDLEAFHFRHTYTEYRSDLWYCIHCADTNNKYCIEFSMKSGGSVSTTNSFYTLNPNRINVGQTSFVDVTLKDTNDILLGKTNGALDTAKSALSVKATSGKYNYNLQFDSITGSYTIRYKYTYDIEGVYTVTATFSGSELKCSDKILNVIMEKISLENSILYIILDSTIQMSTTTTQTIQNTIQIPRYKLALFNSGNVAISSYDQNVNVSCVMTHKSTTPGEEESYELGVYKEDSFIDFIHDPTTQDIYPKLVKGDYYLTVTVGTESKQYKLFLVGTEGSEDASNDPDFDPTKTEFSTVKLEGEAGITYQIILTFKTADGGRWNNEGTLSKFSYSNSYNLNDDKLMITAQKGTKSGIFLININQKVATTGKEGNILTITYDGKPLTTTILIIMKCSALFTLEYESGNRDGTVIDLPTLKFIPKDKYGNIYLDLFDKTKTDQNSLDRLTRGKSLDSVILGTNNYLSENQYLNVQYQTKVATTIQVTSDYFSEIYTYRIRSGPINTNYTYAELKTSGKLAAGSTHDLMIYPRDEFMNVIDNLNEDDLKKFVVHYEVIGSSETFDFSDKCQLVEGYTSSIDVIERRLVEEEEKSYNMIQCSTPVDSIGSIQFYVDYVEKSVECRSCLIALRANEIEFENLQTVYTNKDTTMKTTEKTQVEISSLPKFEVTFHDTFDNVITDASMVEKVELTAELGGTDVKLCVSNSGNKKLITVCPPSNGDDNYNKWNYLTNGEDYSLILKGPSTITYPLELTGGNSDGSSGPVDLSKTYLNPSELTLVAGEEGLVLMEMRTADNKRKNYWYPNIAESIEIDFTADQDTCTYTLAKAEKPGQYNIKFKCTKKTNGNSFSVTVENKQLTQKVNFAIRPGYSYYLEAANPDLFDISGNKFTFKTSPQNGETVTFKFKLLDMYKNYIDNPFEETKTSVLSEVKGTDSSLYTVDYETDSYLFTDKIDEYLEKHTWDIECLLSTNKYYFIYSKVPGAVDPMKSDFTIDKTEYLVKETSTVEVTLKDSYGVNVGIVAGRLEKEKQYLTVQATGESKTLTYVFDSVTTRNTLSYKYTFQNIGKYVVTAEYNKAKIANKGIDISVTYQKYAPAKSQLYIEDADTLMLTTSQTNINNLEIVPYYHFYFYTPEGKKITTYDKSTPITCQMKRNDYTWDLEVTKEDQHVKFTYKDEFTEEFKKLPRGEYQLIVTVDNTPLTYPLFLLGEAGSEDASLSDSYDITKTYVQPTSIDGIVGTSYDINIEFKASDGLRWNYIVQLNSLTVSNSYAFTTKLLVIEKELGAKKGQCILHVTQYKATTGLPDNILTIYYENKALTQQVSLSMKAGKLDNLKYESGKIEGTVIDPPYLVFTPYDAYDNICSDLFDPTITDDKTLQELTTGVSIDGYSLISNNTVVDGQYLNVQYITEQSTIVDVTSPYFPETYSLTINNGPIDPDTTFAELLPKEDNIAGSIQELVIHPKDIYGNDVEELSEEDVDKFKVSYEEVGTPNKHDVSETCNVLDKTIKCSTPVNEAGEIQFHVDYVESPVKCEKCSLNVTSGQVDFSKTTAIYVNDGKELSTSEKTQVEVSSVPTFELTFHDQYNNVITDKAVTEKIDTKPYFLDTDISLCIANKDYHKLVTVCKSEDGENENKWYYLTNGDNYFLKLTREQEEVKYPIEITGGNTEGSSGEIVPEKTNLNPTTLTLTAGVEDKTVLELRTKDDKRRNYWYLKPEDHIKVTFEKDLDTCTYHLNQAEKQGQYYIYFKCTKKVDSNEVTVTIDGEEVPQKVTLKVVPAGPAKALLYDMNDNQITKQDLGSVSVENEYKLKEILFDEYDNRISEITFSSTALGITFNPNVEKRPDSEISASPVIQATGEIIITLKSTLAGEHLLSGNYFPLANYTILFTHGQACAQNSLIEVEKTKIMAGETDKVYIFPYDKYNNKIDANIYKDNSPYQVNYILEGTTVETPITTYEIETVGDETVIAYSAEFTKAGIDTTYGYIATEQAKCVSCTISVGAANVEFIQNNYKRLESSSNTFELIKDGIVEKNTKEAPIYRIYPIDSYGNAIETIPEEKLKTYTCHLKSHKDQVEYYFKLNNEQLRNQPYAEFVKNDGELQYSTLVGGLYDLVFADDEKEVKFVITLEGSSGDSDASNKDPEPKNTHINSFNLKYVAGQKGDMYVELRTEDNLRRNSWNGYNITVESCNKDDKTFKFKTERAGTLGVFYVTVTTQKANTYPKLVECPLTIKVNDEVVQKLRPLMEVSPAAMQSTEILSDYYKVPTSNKVLKDGKADSNYLFEVKSFDAYGNLCPTAEETVGIKVLLVGVEVKTVSSDVVETGFRKYTASTTKAGTYIVSSAINPVIGGSFLPNEPIFEIYPGELSRIVIEALSEEIRAGQKPAVVIQGFDKNDNQIKAQDFKDQFNVKFNDPKNEIHEVTNDVDSNNENKAVYTSKTPVTIVGYVTATADNVVTQEKVDTAHIKILVVPASPDPTKSVLSREISTGVFEVYKNGDSFPVDVNELLILNVTLYDIYGNLITEIPSEASIEDPTMSGNEMEPITFDVANKKTYFKMDYANNQTYINTFTHLVSGNYDLAYEVHSDLGNAPFKYTIIIDTGKDDSTHGNGPVCLDKCILTPTDVVFYAGEFYSLTLELRTNSGLLFNQEINPDDVDVLLNRSDVTFKYSVRQAGNEFGIYTINIYSETKGFGSMNVLIYSADRKERKNAGPVRFRVLPQKIPFKNYTQILTQPEPQISSDSRIEISFLLFDKFGNQFEERDDIIKNQYLSVTNNENLVKDSTKAITDVEKGNKYIITLPVIYPPRKMHINTVYNDGSTSVICFPEDVVTEINVDIDNTLTKVTSKNALKIKVGEALDMQLYVYDHNGICLDSDDFSPLYQIEVNGPLESATASSKKVYYVERTEDSTLECQNKYNIITTSNDKYTKTGTYKIKVTGGDYTVATYTQTCYTDQYSVNGFLLEYPNKDFKPEAVPITDTISFVVSGGDEYGNEFNNPLIDDMTMELSFPNGTKLTSEQEKNEKIEEVSGKLQFNVNVRVVDDLQLHLYFKEEKVLTVNWGEPLPIFTILTGPCRAESNEGNIDITPLEDAEVNKQSYFTINCHDSYGNPINHGGEQFTSTGTLIVNEVQTSIDTKVIDNNDGTYTVKFTPPLAGTYIFRLLVDNEKYGQDIPFEIASTLCSGVEPYRCPNQKKCVSNRIHCIIPENKCPSETPFECQVGGETTCVRSMNDCDCPSGFTRCTWTDDSLKKNESLYCVPEDRKDMCPNFLKSNKLCKRLGIKYIMFKDGICRIEDTPGPSMPVCPIGKVLCADLSCRNSYDECLPENNGVSSYCKSTHVRCPDQSCESSAKYCPSLISCTKEGYVACPNGKCVENEAFCDPIPECTEEVPYLCSNLRCADKQAYCSKNVACGDGKILCEDNICRTSCQ